MWLVYTWYRQTQGKLTSSCDWYIPILPFGDIQGIKDYLGAQVAQWVGLPNNSYKPITGFVNYKKRCSRLAAASDKVYQLVSHGRWFSASTHVSSTNKTDRHDIAELLLKVVLNTINQPTKDFKSSLFNFK